MTRYCPHGRPRRRHRGTRLPGDISTALTMAICVGLLACGTENPSTAPREHEMHSGPGQGPGAGPTLSYGGPRSPQTELNDPVQQIPGDSEQRISPPAGDDWTAQRTLAALPTGGERPQIAIDGNDGRHLVYYHKQGDADVVVYRFGAPETDFGAEVVVSQATERNLGPDLVVSSTGQPWVCYDHAQKDHTGHVFLAHRTAEGWAPLEQVSVATGVETSSSHLAFDEGNTLTVVWVSREPKLEGRSEVLYRVRQEDGSWGSTQSLYRGEQDAFHSNIMRSPSGAQVMGFDIMTQHMHRQVRVAITRDGTWSEFQPVGDAGLSTFRPNFGFGEDGQLFAAWTDSYQHDRVGVSYVTGRLDASDGQWSAPTRPTKGIVGRHFDPDVAGSANGNVMMVSTWSNEGSSAVLYSRWRDGRFDLPQRLSLHQKLATLPSIAAGSDGRFHVVWNLGPLGASEVLYAVTR